MQVMSGDFGGFRFLFVGFAQPTSGQVRHISGVTTLGCPSSRQNLRPLPSSRPASPQAGKLFSCDPIIGDLRYQNGGIKNDKKRFR